jgi:hypothetical protein
MSFLGALSLWIRAKTQPEDIPMYSRAHRKLSKRDLHIAAIIFIILGIIYVIAGLTW